MVIMKKLKLKSKILLPVFALVFISGLVAFFIYNRPISTESVDSPPVAGEDFVAEEVIALADSQEQAQEIADKYGVELKSYAYGVAVFITSSPEESIKLSGTMQRNGASELGFNWLYETYQFDETQSTDTYQINTPRMNAATTKAQSQNDTRVGFDWYHEEIYTERA